MCVSCVFRYNEDLELEDAIHTAILALKVRQAGRQGRVCNAALDGEHSWLSLSAAVVGPGMWRKTVHGRKLCGVRVHVGVRVVCASCSWDTCFLWVSQTHQQRHLL